MLQAKGATLPTIGGAFGKFACGWLGARLGVTRTVLLTEGATVALILGPMALPLAPALALLPLVGIALNGTSSALWSTRSARCSARNRRRSACRIVTMGGAAS